MFSARRPTCIFFSLLLVATTAFAQQAASPAAAPADGTVRLNVAVVDGTGKPAAGLTRQDFTVLDGATAQPLTSFRALTSDASSQVILVIDAVNTPYTALGYQRQQISKYLRANDGVLKQSTTFAVLTDKGMQLYQKTSTNGMELADALDHEEIGLREIGRAQGFWGADDRLRISLSALEQLTAFESKRPGRKLVMWISPGWPLLSGPNIELGRKEQDALFKNAVELSTRLRTAGITLYSLNSWGANEDLLRSNYYETFLKGVTKPREMQIGNLGLQVLAIQSGGLVLNTSDVEGMLKQCVADAESYYELSFKPAPGEAAAEYHPLQVRVQDARLRTRTNTGYYTQP